MLLGNWSNAYRRTGWPTGRFLGGADIEYLEVLEYLEVTIFRQVQFRAHQLEAKRAQVSLKSLFCCCFFVIYWYSVVFQKIVVQPAVEGLVRRRTFRVLNRTRGYVLRAETQLSVYYVIFLFAVDFWIHLVEKMRSFFSFFDFSHEVFPWDTWIFLSKQSFFWLLGRVLLVNWPRFLSSPDTNPACCCYC